MPEMRAETGREARRKKMGGQEDITDPNDVMSVSRPLPEPAGSRDGDDIARAVDRPHLRTARAERLRTGRHLERGESGGPQ